VALSLGLGRLTSEAILNCIPCHRHSNFFFGGYYDLIISLSKCPRRTSHTPRGRAFNVLSTGQSSQSKPTRNCFYGHKHWFEGERYGALKRKRPFTTTLVMGELRGMDIVWGGTGRRCRQLLNGSLFRFENQRLFYCEIGSQSLLQIPQPSH